MPQPRWKDQLCKQNKLDKSSNFAVNAKHAIEEQSQSQSCFESKVGERFRLIALSFLTEQLRRGCCTCKNNHESETLEFKLHSFRASQRYLAHKNPTRIQHMVEEQHQFFNLVQVVF